MIRGHCYISEVLNLTKMAGRLYGNVRGMTFDAMHRITIE